MKNKATVVDIFQFGSGDNPFVYSENFVDWGKNPITNGGNEPNQWRTLTSEEWTYLFSGRDNWEQLAAFGQVEGMIGVIVLPDGCENAAELGFKAIPKDSIANNGRLETKNWNSDIYKENVFTAAQWQKLEDAGALFLPLNEPENNGGHYWTTTDKYCSIGKRIVWPDRGCTPNIFSMAVRLAKDTK